MAQDLKNIFKNRKYDLIFSIGQACSCTEVLRKAHLQFYSYPFDWLFGSNFIDRIKMLSNNMKNFIDKDDLEYSYEEISISCNAYHNKRTDITFNHDFKKNLSFNEAYKEVSEKYKRRINRLYKQIEQSEKILAVYLQRPNENSVINENELIDGLNILEEKFGKNKVFLLYLYCDPNFNFKNKQINLLNDKIMIINFDYSAHDKNVPIKPNYRALNKIFNKFKISNKFLNSKNRRARFIYLIKIFFKGDLWK